MKGEQEVQWGDSSRTWVQGRGGTQVQALKLEPEHQSRVSGVLSQKPVRPAAEGVGSQPVTLQGRRLCPTGLEL